MGDSLEDLLLLVILVICLKLDSEKGLCEIMCRKKTSVSGSADAGVQGQGQHGGVKTTRKIIVKFLFIFVKV